VNLKFGAAYDEASRSIRAYDNSTAFQTSVCGATCDGTTGLGAQRRSPST
jgi:hypothetical protein